MKILLASSYYWPEGAGNAPYVTGLAEHLCEQGHDVIVTTGFPHYPDWTSSATRRLSATERRNGVTIRRRWHYVPGTQSAVHRAAYELSLFALGMTAIPIRWRADVIVGTCPSLAGGILAAAAAALYRAPYGLVFQDLMGLAAEQSGVAGGARVAGVVRGVEMRLAKRARMVGVIAEGFRRYLEQGGVASDRIVRLRNWTRRTEPNRSRDETRSRFGWPPDEFVCVHGGNMGHKQGLDNLLDTATVLQDKDIRIALVGDGNDRSRLEHLAVDRHLQNLQFIPLQGPGDWEATMEASDALLVNQRPSVADMSLPSKLTSYFASAKPVVAAVSADSETAAEILASNAGIVVDPADPAAFGRAILNLRENPIRARTLGERGRDYARTTLTKESALAGYDAFIGRILAN